MTFPRGLTPSDKERSAVTQTRMSPGAAGGISRHVRRAARPAPTSTTAQSGGAVLAAGDINTALSPAFGSFHRVEFDPISIIDQSPATVLGVDGPVITDYISVNSDGDVVMTSAGWYQVAGVWKLELGTAAMRVTMQVLVPGSGTRPNVYNETDSDTSGNVRLAGTSVPFYNGDAGTTLPMTVGGYDDSGGWLANLHVVKLAD